MPFSWRDCQLAELFTSDKRENVILPTPGWLRVASQGSTSRLFSSVMPLNGGDVIHTKTCLVKQCVTLWCCVQMNNMSIVEKWLFVIGSV